MGWSVSGAPQSGTRYPTDVKLIAVSQPMRDLLRQARRYATVDATVADDDFAAPRFDIS